MPPIGLNLLGAFFYMEKSIAVLIDGGHLRVLAKQANKLYNPDLIELLCNCLAKSIESPAVNEASVGYECNNAVAIDVQSIRGPSEKPRIHVVYFGLLRGRRFDVCVFYQLVDFRIFSVLVIVVLTLLIGIVWWIADDN